MLNFNHFSCRYDTFFNTHTLKLNFDINNNVSKENAIVDIYNLILEDIIKMNEDDLNNENLENI